MSLPPSPSSPPLVLPPTTPPDAFELVCIEEECIDDNILATEDGESNVVDTEIGNPDEIIHEGGITPSSELDMGVAANNASHVYDLSDEWVRPLANRSLWEILNDVYSYYDKAKKEGENDCWVNGYPNA